MLSRCTGATTEKQLKKNETVVCRSRHPCNTNSPRIMCKRAATCVCFDLNSRQRIAIATSTSMTVRTRFLGLLAAVCGCRHHVASGFSFGSPWGITITGTHTAHWQPEAVAVPLKAAVNRRSQRPSSCRPHSVKSWLKAEVLAEGAPARSVGTGSPGRKVVEDQFERWAAQAGIKAPKLRHDVFPDELVGDLRGLKAVEATSKSERLVIVPSKAAVTLMASESSPFKSWVSPDFWERQQWYVKLALKLLWERQLGTASAVEGYVNLLPPPGSFNTLIHWTDQELDMLNYPKCADSAKRQRGVWDKLHQDLVAQCPDGAGRVVTRDDLVWAMECVLSRAFNGRFGGGQKSAILSVGLAVAAGAVYWATEQPVWVLLAALALLPLTLPELGSVGTALMGKMDEADDYVLVPFVDSMNHVTTATTSLSFSPLSGDLGVSVNRGYAEGEQAFISYGLKSNDELLLFYGFVEADCPADTYFVGDIVTKLGVPKDRIAVVEDASLRAALDMFIICRGPDVISIETLAGLRLLLQVAETGDGDGAIWRALRTVCEAELVSVKPSPAVRDAGGSVRERLALAFRREKASVLEEAIRNMDNKLS